MQRQKDFSAYQDLESSFERRPSLWAEPIGDWGEGAVKLIEIPTKEEIHDNIAAFWQPKAPLAGQGRTHLHLSAALGAGCAEAAFAGAIFPNRHRRERRQRHDLRARRDRRQAEIGRSENAARRRDGREGQDPEHRHPAKSGDRRLALEFRTRRRKRSRRNARIAHAGRRAGIGSLGLSMDTLAKARGSSRAGDTPLNEFLPAGSADGHGGAVVAAVRAASVRFDFAPMWPRRGFILTGTAIADRGRLLRDVPGAPGRRRDGSGMRSSSRCSCCCLPGSPFPSCQRLPASSCCCSRTKDELGIDPTAPLPAIHSRTAMLLPTYNEDPLSRAGAAARDLRIGRGDRTRRAFRLVHSERHHRSRDLDRRGKVVFCSCDSESAAHAHLLSPPPARTPRANPAISRIGSSGSAPTMSACSILDADSLMTGDTHRAACRRDGGSIRRSA